jgi:hypothetical protein
VEDIQKVATFSKEKMKNISNLNKNNDNIVTKVKYNKLTSRKSTIDANERKTYTEKDKGYMRKITLIKRRF